MYADKTNKNKNQCGSNNSAPASGRDSATSLQDNRPQSQNAPVLRKKANDTGLPDQLKSGIENISGYSMDDVKVHYNSAKPAQLNAHAYAQGSEIHVSSGQEKHLAHEAWHVVQQKQGRVKPTQQLKSKVNINDDKDLEKEADEMGSKALQQPVQRKEKKTVDKPGTNHSSTAQLVIDGYKPGTILRSNYLVMKDLSDKQQEQMQDLHNEVKVYTVNDARKAVGAAPLPEAAQNSNVPFPFRFEKQGEYAMKSVSDDATGFVQYPKSGVPPLLGQHPQISVVAESAFDDLQKGSKRAVTQSAVMEVSPNEAARRLHLPDGPWEWLHLVAFSIKQTHVGALSDKSFALLSRTGQPQQIRENLVLGTAGANTAMLTYETVIKDVMRENPKWTLELSVIADVRPMKVDGVIIPVANRINYDLFFRTETGKVTSPIVLAFNPLAHKAPTLGEYGEVVAKLRQFLKSNQSNVKVEGMDVGGFEEV